MKTAAVVRAFSTRRHVSQTLVHTGQHYDAGMSDVFFNQLDMPEPDVNLRVGSGSHAQQTAEVMMRIEPVLLNHAPDWVMVYGDVNSTLAAALVCAKLGVKVAHVEAGLRSFDRTMPEEVNRLLTDQLADLLLTPSIDANDNLLREGIVPEKVCLVGNVMIDTLIRMLPKVQQLQGLPDRYALVTMHRPGNVDDPVFLRDLLETLAEVSGELPIIFPVHPRTRARMNDMGLSEFDPHVRITTPLPYLEFLALEANATLVITDSGGIQEETTFLKVPCLTVRENTERPITTTVGSNILVGRDMRRLQNEIQRILDGFRAPTHVPALWDGRAAERIADRVLNSRSLQSDMAMAQTQ